jgi:hypothetical protein
MEDRTESADNYFRSNHMWGQSVKAMPQGVADVIKLCHMRRTLTAFLLIAGLGIAQSPPAKTEITVGGKKISVNYSAPSLRGRKDIFGAGGPIKNDPTYPVWRAGANNATTLHTDADLMIGSLHLPKGDYTLFVDVGKSPWQLIVNKQTGQGGLDYDAKQDLGRVPMKMSKPSSTVETFKITLTQAGGSNAKLEMAWENTAGSVDIMVH